MHTRSLHPAVQTCQQKTPDPFSPTTPFLRLFSTLVLLIPERAVRRGIERMEDALRAGPIRRTERYLLLWGTKRAAKSGG